MLLQIFFLMILAHAQMDNEITLTGRIRKAIIGPSSPAPGERAVIAEFTRCENRTVHLTFDDGPNPNTLKILQVLKKHNIKATFFVLGEKLRQEKNREIIRYIKGQGHTIGLHGYTHRNFGRSNPQDINKEFAELDQVLQEDLGDGTTMKDSISPVFRLPYGAGWLRASQKDVDAVLPHSAKAIFENLNQRGWGHMGWHIDSMDSRIPSNASVEKIATETTEHKGGVILFHDTNPKTTILLHQFLSKYKKDFCFVDGATYAADQSLKIMSNVGVKKFCQ